MAFIESLITTISGRRDEVIGEIRRLEDAKKSLTNGSASSAKAQTNANTPRRKPSGHKPIDEDAIVRACFAHGGPISATEIRTAIGLSDDQSNALSVRLTRMVQDGKLRKIGERRGTRYLVPS